MRAKILGIGLGAVVAIVHSQTLDLRGRVVQGDGEPVPDASVELKTRGTSARTGADGFFTLNENTAIGPGPAHPVDYRLDARFLHVDAGVPIDLRMEVIDAAGRSLGASSRVLGIGRHRISWEEAMPNQVGTAGVHFLRLHLGDRLLTHPFFHAGPGARGTVFAPAHAVGAAGKRAAVVDSLRIRKSGYEELTLPVTSYTAGALGDLVLTLSGGEGSICAKQRMQRTDEGDEVVFCEQLFEQPPRVRLPAAALPAYAEMTADSFLTLAGESYPHAIRNSSDLEVRRHASALYEIRIRNGKLEGFRPAIVFAESLFMVPLMGKAFDGLISKRTAANRFELMPSLPVRVRILAEGYQGESNGASGFKVKAVIANLETSITASDGTCMPSLSGYGSQAPFNPGAQVLLTVGRVPSMHVFGNNELVFDLYAGDTWMGGLMSPTWFFKPSDLVKNTLAPLGAYRGVGHGAPGSIPMLDLRPASGGGTPCSGR